MSTEVKNHRAVLVDEDGNPCGIVDNLETARDLVESDAYRFDHIVDHYPDVPHFEVTER